MTTQARNLALEAAAILVTAYRNGKRRGGTVEWSDVDIAHEFARRALAEERWSRRQRPDRTAGTLADFLAEHALDPTRYPEHYPIGDDADLLSQRIVCVADGPKHTRAIFLEGGVVIVETPWATWLVS